MYIYVNNIYLSVDSQER